MSRAGRILAALALCLALASLTQALALPALAAAAELPEGFLALPTRPGVTVPLAVISPERPRAVVILLAGGQGVVRISGRDNGRDNGHGNGHDKGHDGQAEIRNGGNFLVRSRQLFAAQGLAVLTMDVPSDHSDGMSAWFRFSPEHVADLRAVAAYARERWHLAPWLVGTSMGTISAARAAGMLPAEELGGVVLTSTIAKAAKRWDLPGAYQKGVLDAGLGTVRVPALVVRHRDDGCAFSAPEAGPRILDALSASPRKALLTFEGGAPAQSEACEARSPHGYLGIEEQVVAGIAGFILNLDARP
ncbi:MAG: alpha/beta hydrolase [Desulfovibrio sp.]|jgi:hypothetical protein|nr:alpha/beta hydrolase [Desulfovibrio sp.]